MPSGAQMFAVGDNYERFMGRYSARLAAPFSDFAGVSPGERAIDIGCGTGALTVELVRRLGADAVAGCDPSPMLGRCRERCPGVDLRSGSAEQIPFDDDVFDVGLSQLVFHFVSDPARGIGEVRRVVRPGGRMALAVWDGEGGMRLIGQFWLAAKDVDPAAGGETMTFGAPGELAELLTSAGLDQVRETTLEVSAPYGGFAELWESVELGVGPVGVYLQGLTDEHRDAIRTALFERLESPTGAFALEALARAAVAVAPS